MSNRIVWVATSLSLLVGCSSESAETSSAGATSGAGGATTSSTASSVAASGTGGGGSTAETRIYATVVSHNEEDTSANCKNGPNNDPAKYAANRSLLKKLAEGIVARGATFDQQNEWEYLSRVADPTYETDSLKAGTGGKNILAYLASLDGERISIDVHHHPSKFTMENHADVAGRLAELGVMEQGVVGGFIFSPAASAEVDAMRGYAAAGLVSTKTWSGKKFTWWPKILWGGGSANHASDSEASGVWRPKSNADFYTDDPASPLPNLGHYKGNLDFTGMADLVAKYKGGMLPKGQMLTVTLMVNQCEMTEASVAATLAEIDKYADGVKQGYVVWKTLPGIVAEWKSVYASAPQIFNAN